MNQTQFKALWSPHPDAPAQDRHEFFWLVNKVESLNPKAIIEIGVARGGSLRYWEYLVGKGNLVIGVDINPDTPRQIEEWWDFKHSDRDLHVITGDSLNPEVINRVKKLLGDKKADSLFIDGNHEPDYIFREFVTYGAFIRYGGIIAFHDIRPEMNLQYVFNKIRGRTERFLRIQGIGIYWKEKIDFPVIFRRTDRISDPETQSWPFDLDDYQTKRIEEVWNSLKFNKWED